MTQARTLQDDLIHTRIMLRHRLQKARPECISDDGLHMPIRDSQIPGQWHCWRCGAILKKKDLR